MRFLTLLRYQLAAYRGMIVGWGAALLILAVYLALLHDAFASQQEQFTSLLSAYPPEMMAAFGGTADLFQPTGFLNTPNSCSPLGYLLLFVWKSSSSIS